MNEIIFWTIAVVVMFAVIWLLVMLCDRSCKPEPVDLSIYDRKTFDITPIIETGKKWYLAEYGGYRRSIDIHIGIYPVAYIISNEYFETREEALLWLATKEETTCTPLNG